eukprot:g25238.t1
MVQAYNGMHVSHTSCTAGIWPELNSCVRAHDQQLWLCHMRPAQPSLTFLQISFLEIPCIVAPKPSSDTSFYFMELITDDFLPDELRQEIENRRNRQEEEEKEEEEEEEEDEEKEEKEEKEEEQEEQEEEQEEEEEEEEEEQGEK